MRKKLKYQGGLTKIICQQKAHRHKNAFKKKISESERFFTYPTNNHLKFEVISFSGVSSFEDQLLSIYSLLINVGLPLSWTLYSDGSYTQQHIDVFKKEFPFIIIKNWNEGDKYLVNKYLHEYSKVCNLYKKINLIASHYSDHQLMYVDSDIIFYQNMLSYINSELLDTHFWYVPDAIGSVKKYFTLKPYDIYTLNSGLLFFNKHLNVGNIFEYLESLNGDYNYFSEQSSFDYAFKKQHAKILDPRQFIVDSSDQFDFSAKFRPDEIAMRHYTTPIRHKIWQNGWKWHFNTL